MFDDRPFLSVKVRPKNGNSPVVVTLSDDDEPGENAVDEVRLDDGPGMMKEGCMDGRSDGRASSVKRKPEKGDASEDLKPEKKRVKLERVDMSGEQDVGPASSSSVKNELEAGTSAKGCEVPDVDEKEAERRVKLVLAAFDPLPPLSGDKLVIWNRLQSRVRRLPTRLKLDPKFLELVDHSRSAVREARAAKPPPSKKWLYRAVNVVFGTLKELWDEARQKTNGGAEVTVPAEFVPKRKNGKVTPAVARAMHKLDIKRDQAEFSNDEKRKKTIRLLEKSLNAAIVQRQLLEEREVDFDDEQQSAYCQLERLDKRILEISQKIKGLRKEAVDDNEGVPKKIRYNGTEWREVNKKVERLINEDAKFPDYHDILKILKDARSDGLFKMDEEELGDRGRKIFAEIGKLLKKRRIKETQQTLADIEDAFREVESQLPADDPELESKLQENARLGEKRMQELYDSFAQKQDEMGELPEEVPDDTADLSDRENDSSDDDEEEAAEEDEEEGDLAGEGEEEELDNQTEEAEKGSDDDDDGGEEDNELPKIQEEEKTNGADLIEDFEDDAKSKHSTSLESSEKENDAQVIENFEAEKKTSAEDEDIICIS